MNGFRRIYSFPYMHHKKWWFTISAVVIIAGLVSMFVKGGGNPADGFNYGLEFKEGTRINVVFSKPGVSVGDVRSVMSGQGFADAQIQSATSAGKQSFQIQTKSLSAPQQDAVKQALDQRFGIAPDGWSLDFVGATFGSQVKTASVKAVVIALLLILAYVSFRFQWKFAVGAVAAEVHDLLVVLGVYSITGREVTTATIAAVLTILGYSLYDTVIVYDRIRENQTKLSRLPYADVVDRSIWETLTRSINTTMIVLLPVLCLLLFGGATLKDFAFALLIGIISGAYSSIFVASPVLTLLREREPQYRKLAARADES